MHKATFTIQDEHRSLAAVLHGLLHVADDIASHGTRPDFRLLWMRQRASITALRLTEQVRRHMPIQGEARHERHSPCLNDHQRMD